MADHRGRKGQGRVGAEGVRSLMSRLTEQRRRPSAPSPLERIACRV